MRKITLAAAFFALASYAHAQGTFPLNNVPIGKGPGKTGFTAVPPGAENACLMIIAGVPTFQTCPGAGTGGTVSTLNAGDGITLTPNPITTVGSIKVTTGAANTMKGSLNGTTTTDIALTACTLAYQVTKWVAGTGWQCGLNPVLPSRTIAATLDLSAFSVITTQGWSVAGDGGGATLTKTAGSFIDTRILTGAITNNGTSTCTNGTYFGIPFSGGSGRSAYAQVTVAGNVVTAVSMGGQSTAGYAAGNVLSATVTGCSTTVTWTVATVTTPTGSFTDSAGNKWQIGYPAAGLDARSMGVKFDWDGSDGTATDNWTTLQNALSFAGYPTSTIVDLGGTWGGVVLLPKQTAMFCGGGTVPIVVPLAVKVIGQGNYTTVLKPCDTWATNQAVFYLCDPFTHFACFGTMLQDLQIFTQRDVGGTTNAATVYTNNAQHEAGLRNVVIYPGACKIAVYFDQGYGGATYITLDNVEVKGGKGTASCGGVDNPSVKIAYGTTQVWIKNLVIGGLSASFNGPRKTGLAISGGFVTINGFHPEQIIDPILINIPTSLSNGQVRLSGATGGVDCVGLIVLSASNFPGNFMLGPPNAINGCTRMVTNGQPAGSNLINPVLIDTIFNP